MGTGKIRRAPGRLIRHAWYFIRQLAESYLTRHLFSQILGRIERLAWHPTRSSGLPRGGAGMVPAGVSLRWVVTDKNYRST